MNPVDLIITIILVGAAINGMRRGFIREALIFALWLPIYVVSTMLVLTAYNPATDAQTSAASSEVLWLLAFIFFVGSVFIFLLNKSIIQPWLLGRRLHNTQAIDTLLGFALGGVRFLTVFFATVMIYDIFVVPFSLTGVPNSVYVKEAYQQSVPVKRWLIEEGYIDIEIILYDREFEEKKNKMNKFMDDVGMGGRF